MSFAKRIISEREAVLELVKGKTEDGKKFFAFIFIRSSELNKIKQSRDSRLIDFSNHGIILYSDFGHEVSEDIEKKVIELFNEKYEEDCK